VFFVLFYVYLWLGVQTQLIYHGGIVIVRFPTFFTGWDFFSGFLHFPGGILEYVSAFLFQFFYLSWAGAIVITLQAWLIYVCFDYVLKSIKAGFLRWMRFLPPVLLMVAYSRYTNHFLTTMAMLAGLIFICLYLKLSREQSLGRSILFVCLSVTAYYLAGGAMLFFAVVCGLYELFFRKSVQLAIVCLLSAIIIPYIGSAFLFNLSYSEAYTELLPISHRIHDYQASTRLIEIIYSLYLLLPLAVIAMGLWHKFKKPSLPKSKKQLKADTKKNRQKKNIQPDQPSLFIQTLKWTIQTLILFAVAGAVVVKCHDITQRTKLRIDYYACNEKWDEILKNTPDELMNNYFVIHTINRALYHTGRLGEDMFRYPQHPDALFLTIKGQMLVYWRNFDIHFDLGSVNMAENALIESMIGHEKRPHILKKLAVINMAKGYINTAKVYLTLLSKTLFYSDWAKAYLKKIEQDPQLLTDSDIQRRRSLIEDKNYSFNLYVSETVLLKLLEKNRHNKMAFEYLMASYLVTRQLDNFVRQIHRINDFNYSRIPTLYQEAIIIYEVMTGKKIKIKGLQISPDTYRRATSFSSITSRLHDRSAAEVARVTVSDYGGSYFFYYNFGPVLIKK